MKSLAVAFIAALAACSSAHLSEARAADDYPAKPIRFVVPYPPGGGTGLVARIVAQKLSENIGQPVVVDNRPGASGMIAHEIAARSQPDGYTIMIDQTSITINPALYPSMTYDVRRDFSPITLAVTTDHVLLVRPSLPAKAVTDLIALAKSQPGKLNYASPGSGTPQHVGMELFKRMAGLDVVHIPYKGGGPAITALLGGEVQMFMTAISTGLTHVKAGTLRALATAGTTRSKTLPEVPTVAESGLPGYVSTIWLGVFAPGKTPRPIVNRLNAEFVKALASPDIRGSLAKMDWEVVASTPEAFEKIVDEELLRYAKVVREAGIRVE